MANVQYTVWPHFNNQFGHISTTSLATFQQPTWPYRVRARADDLQLNGSYCLGLPGWQPPRLDLGDFAGCTASSLVLEGWDHLIDREFDGLPDRIDRRAADQRVQRWHTPQHLAVSSGR